MSLVAAGEILAVTARVRTLTIAHHPEPPDGAYAMVDTYCTDLGCDCRKTMILVHLDQRHVATINFGWESPEFYARWYGAPPHDRTLAELQGPSTDLNSPGSGAAWRHVGLLFRAARRALRRALVLAVRPLPCRHCHSSRRAAAGAVIGTWRRSPY